MTFQQLEYIVEISKCGSINKAAQKLFLSQSGISTAVRELENGSFNYQLLELGRMPRLYPTDEECAAMLEHYRTRSRSGNSSGGFRKKLISTC